MRIGLYLDFAVGVAPDGSATWSDRALLVPGARIGAPPDYFNAAGQDWGLSPISPVGARRAPLPADPRLARQVLAHAGALRIDHAMSLYRLFWIAHGFSAADGAYVRYPFADLVRTVAEVSQARQAIVIGEDLGIVPDGFRDAMHAADIQSYRVLFFEKRDDHFLPADAYPREALACITTHDTQTLAGWWSGHDLATRAGIGMIGAEALPAEREARAHERRRLLGLLEGHGLLPPELAPVMRGEAEAPVDLPRFARRRAAPLHRAHAVAAGRRFRRRPRRRARPGQHPRHGQRASQLAAEARRDDRGHRRASALRRGHRGAPRGAAEVGVAALDNRSCVLRGPVATRPRTSG